MEEKITQRRLRNFYNKNVYFLNKNEFKKKMKNSKEISCKQLIKLLVKVY